MVDREAVELLVSVQDAAPESRDHREAQHVEPLHESRDHRGDGYEVPVPGSLDDGVVPRWLCHSTQGLPGGRLQFLAGRFPWSVTGSCYHV